MNGSYRVDPIRREAAVGVTVKALDGRKSVTADIASLDESSFCFWACANPAAAVKLLGSALGHGAASPATQPRDAVTETLSESCDERDPLTLAVAEAILRFGLQLCVHLGLEPTSKTLVLCYVSIASNYIPKKWTAYLDAGADASLREMAGALTDTEGA